MIAIRLCSICQRAKRVNLIIRDKNICLECEKALVETTSTQKSYGYYMDAVKKLLYNSAN
ncbi:MAG: sigma factor G inhibitor Gin [Caldicoprobacterales bacterium]|jgi:hypothetical protein|nr:sigma factor G inhibitor Gin [Clostridia bacterium]NLH58107.1 hypothetical protein [Clostridiales bacterium]